MEMRDYMLQKEMYSMPAKNHRHCQQQLMFSLVSSSNLDMYLALGMLLAEKHLRPLLWIGGAEDCLKISQKTQQKIITPAEKKGMSTSFSHNRRLEPYQ